MVPTETSVCGAKLDTASSFKYLGSVVSGIAQTTAVVTKLRPIWNVRNVTLRSKIILMRPLVISIFLYACESWTLTAELEIRIQMAV